MLEVIHRGGFRHGDIKSQEEKDFDGWWRKRVVELIRDPLDQELLDRAEAYGTTLAL